MRVRVTATVDTLEGNTVPAGTVSVVVDSYDGFLAVVRNWFGRLAAYDPPPPAFPPGASPVSPIPRS
jgi:hypothetical protein